MLNLKALAAGTALIILFGLTLQLIFLVAATGYTIMIRDYPDFQLTGKALLYALGGLGYFIIMSASGYVTANIAKKNIYIHAIIIASATTLLSMISLLNESGLSLNSILFVLLGILFTCFGGYIWTKHHKDEQGLLEH